MIQKIRDQKVGMLFQDTFQNQIQLNQMTGMKVRYLMFIIYIIFINQFINLSKKIIISINIVEDGMWIPVMKENPEFQEWYPKVCIYIFIIK